MKKVKMYFPEFINVRGTEFLADAINEVADTPGSVQRWILRGCKIVEEKVDEKVEVKIENPIEEVKEPKVEEKVEEEEVVVEEVKEESKKKNNKRNKSSK